MKSYKLWDAFKKNSKHLKSQSKSTVEKEKVNLSFQPKTKRVVRKIIPLFVDDDNKVIERENIVNMYNKFCKENNSEYTEKYMDNLFNSLFQTKKNYSVKDSRKILPEIRLSKIKDNLEPKKDEEDCFESFDSEDENKTTFNCTKLVVKLKRNFPFYEGRKSAYRDREQLRFLTNHNNIYSHDGYLRKSNPGYNSFIKHKIDYTNFGNSFSSTFRGKSKFIFSPSKKTPIKIKKSVKFSDAATSVFSSTQKPFFNSPVNLKALNMKRE